MEGATGALLSIAPSFVSFACGKTRLWVLIELNVLNLLDLIWMFFVLRGRDKLIKRERERDELIMRRG